MEDKLKFLFVMWLIMAVIGAIAAIWILFEIHIVLGIGGMYLIAAFVYGLIREV